MHVLNDHVDGCAEEHQGMLVQLCTEIHTLEKRIDKKEVLDKANAEARKDGQEGHDDGQQYEKGQDDKVPRLAKPEDDEHGMKYAHAECHDT